MNKFILVLIALGNVLYRFEIYNEYKFILSLY